MTELDRFSRAALLATVLCLQAAAVQASCGASSCNLLNDRFALGTWEHPGWSIDLRLEALTQDRLREGSRTISPAELPAGEEAIERHTRNRNLVATLDYALNHEWSFALRLPLLQRDHLHDLLDEESGDIAATEQWRFSKAGDAQVLARWQAPGSAAGLGWALTGGLKLPTGSTGLVNAEGTPAERTLQPGSGTTDLIVGASARIVIGISDALSLQGNWTEALAAHDGFKPGRRVDLSAGWAHAMSPAWSVLLQANLARRERDSGVQAEPALSGSTTLSLSPGVSVLAAAGDTLYAFVQLPIYQKVNGIQLVPQAGLVVGWTHSF
jgi:hypothetical protein